MHGILRFKYVYILGHIDQYNNTNNNTGIRLPTKRYMPFHVKIWIAHYFHFRWLVGHAYDYGLLYTSIESLNLH